MKINIRVGKEWWKIRINLGSFEEALGKGRRYFNITRNTNVKMVPFQIWRSTGSGLKMREVHCHLGYGG